MSNKIVKCTNCNEIIYEYIGKGGNEHRADEFLGINGNESPKPGEPMLCPKCNYDIFNDFRNVVLRHR